LGLERSWRELQAVVLERSLRPSPLSQPGVLGATHRLNGERAKCMLFSTWVQQ
jgi:hypothetical protein